MIGYEAGDLVKMSILVNDEPVDALSMIVHRSRAEQRGRAMCEKLKGADPEAPVQDPDPSGARAKIIARETISALRKDVTAKCYGGDITRKTQAARQAEGGEEEDAPVRPRRDSPGRLHRSAQDGRELING